MSEVDEAAVVLTDSLDAVQIELADAEIALLEATARAEKAREAALRLQSAVAALSGESPPATPDKPFFPDDPHTKGSRDSMHDMTPDEFDAQRVKRQRAREKADIDDNPLAHLKCTGCGRTGTMRDTIMKAPSGASVRMMVCSGCGNQIMT